PPILQYIVMLRLVKLFCGFFRVRHPSWATAGGWGRSTTALRPTCRSRCPGRFRGTCDVRLCATICGRDNAGHVRRRLGAPHAILAADAARDVAFGRGGLAGGVRRALVGVAISPAGLMAN